jgi:hypothetical protein
MLRRWRTATLSSLVRPTRRSSLRRAKAGEGGAGARRERRVPVSPVPMLPSGHINAAPPEPSNIRHEERSRDAQTTAAPVPRRYSQGHFYHGPCAMEEGAVRRNCRLLADLRSWEASVFKGDEGWRII